MIETKKNEIQKIKFFGQTIYHFSDLSSPDTKGDCDVSFNDIVDAKESKEGNKRKKKSDNKIRYRIKRYFQKNRK